MFLGIDSNLMDLFESCEFDYYLSVQTHNQLPSITEKGIGGGMSGALDAFGVFDRSATLMDLVV